MIVTLLAVLVGVLHGAASVQAPAQTCRGLADPANQHEFIACARAGTERYRDRGVAISEGYRRIGRDFPGMGEHWIRMSLVFDGTFDAAHPELLNYITVGGQPHLVGVAYALPLLAGESPPTTPAGPNAWHEHSRTLDDETLLPRHRHGDTVAGSRLAMLHAWIWSPNPDGMFAADNWALPFLRLGLDAPADLPSPAGKALALASGAREYFELAIHAGARLSAEDTRHVVGALGEAQRKVEMVVEDLKQRGENGRPATTKLAGIWTQLWVDIERTVSDEARRQLALVAIR